MTAMQPDAPAQPRGTDDGTDAHLLRLCLDLQLDALLLTLGASAAQQARERADPADPAAGVVPWRRWVAEDVDLAVTLACDATAGRAALPPTLGNDLAHQVPATVVDDLAARYASMRDLLTDLLHLDTAGQDDRWRPRVRDALHRCATRLVELREYRLAATPPRGVRLPDHDEPRGQAGRDGQDGPGAAAGSPLAPGHAYLPGELLG